MYHLSLSVMGPLFVWLPVVDLANHIIAGNGEVSLGLPLLAPQSQIELRVVWMILSAGLNTLY